MANDRRIFFFNPIELKILLFIFLLSAVPVMIVSGFFLSLFGDLAYSYLGSEMADQLLRQYLSLTIVMLLYNFIFVVIMACYFIHKLYGPIPRILREVDEVLAGRSTSKLYLRKGDLIGELTKRINALIDKLPK